MFGHWSWKPDLEHCRYYASYGLLASDNNALYMYNLALDGCEDGKEKVKIVHSITGGLPEYMDMQLGQDFPHPGVVD